MRSGNGKLGLHPWVSYLLGLLLLAASVAFLAGRPNSDAAANPNALLAAQAFFARSAQLPLSGWPGFGMSTADVSIHSSLGSLLSHEAPAALGLTLVFFLIVAISLEKAWGSLLFGGFCLLLPLLSGLSYSLLYGEAGVAWTGPSIVMAALLGAYTIRSLRGLAIPAWLLVPAWCIAEYLFFRDVSLEGFDPVPVTLHSLGFAFGAVSASLIWALRLEEKLAPAREDTRDRVSNPVLGQALELRKQGNPQAAFDLLNGELQRSPDNHDLAVALWQASSGTEQARRAVPALLGTIGTHLRNGRREAAIAFWLAIHAEVEDTQVEPSLSVRIGEALLAEEQHEPAMRALAAAIAGPKAVAPVWALRVARGAWGLDADLASSAAAMVLAGDPLAPSERAEMQRILRTAGGTPGSELPSERPPGRIETSCEPPGEALSGFGPSGVRGAETVAKLAPDREAVGGGFGVRRASSDVSETTETLLPAAELTRLHPLDGVEDLSGVPPGRRVLRVRRAVPLGLDDEGISLDLEGRGKTRLAYSRIEAVAVGAVQRRVAKPVLVVDIVLNYWMDLPDQPLRVIRMRSDNFDPRSIVADNGSALASLRAMLEQLLQRSGATPLPNRAAALGLPFTTHADIDSYGQTVLLNR